MRTILIAAVMLAACGDDASSAHDDVDCDKAWFQKKCDRACQLMPAPTTPGGCAYTNTWVQPSQPATCGAGQQTTFDGQVGCCVILGPLNPGGTDPMRIAFFECE